jgi:hypothetical protein
MKVPYANGTYDLETLDAVFIHMVDVRGVQGWLRGTLVVEDGGSTPCVGMQKCAWVVAKVNVTGSFSDGRRSELFEQLDTKEILHADVMGEVTVIYREQPVYKEQSCGHGGNILGIR